MPCIKDVRLIRDEYLECIVGQTDVRTLTQPSTEQSASFQRLREVMRDADLGSGSFAGQIVDLDAVDRVMQVEEVRKLIESVAQAGVYT